MARRSFLRLTNLEDRLTPSTFGTTWADANHLTISFAPDGTWVDGAKSVLFQTLSGQTAAWQTEILRAVQTWAQYANVNVAVTGDGGLSLGTSGATQGDTRFGDIRIAARPLSDNVLAITAPPGIFGGTRAGDIVINSNKVFGPRGYDLYSVMLQEVGHALGVGNSTDPNSPMFEQYSGIRTGLTADDIADIRTLYGARIQDSFEGSNGNATENTADSLGRPFGYISSASLVVTADITTTSDVDVYRVRTLQNNPYGMMIRLDAGMSLLAPKITIFGPDGQQLAMAQSVEPATGELFIKLRTVQSNADYLIRVESANTYFSVGQYQLKVIFDPTAPDAAVVGSETVLNDNHTDDTTDNAYRLDTAAGYTANTHYQTFATLRDSNDVDVYEIRSPNVGANRQVVMTVNVRSTNPAVLDPLVFVYDKNKRLVNARIVINDNGTYAVQIANATPNERYYIDVRADGVGGVGEYCLDVDFRSIVIKTDEFALGTLTAQASTSYRTMNVLRSQLTHFELTASGAADAGVRLVIFDGKGRVVATLFAQSGQTLTMDTYLAAGTYTVRFDGLTRGGIELPTLTYSLWGASLTDPIGPTAADPNAPTDDYTWDQFAADYYAMLVLADPGGTVVW